jgi:hypothetical protein
VLAGECINIVKGVGESKDRGCRLNLDFQVSDASQKLLGLVVGDPLATLDDQGVEDFERPEGPGPMASASLSSSARTPML